MSSPPPKRIPVHEKPETQGVTPASDGNVSIYLCVAQEDSFDSAAQRLLSMIKDAQESFPRTPRVLYVDIDGHEGPHQGFDRDFFEFQQAFIFSTVAPFVSALSLPLVSVLNPTTQKNALPDLLRIESDADDSRA